MQQHPPASSRGVASAQGNASEAAGQPEPEQPFSRIEAEEEETPTVQVDPPPPQRTSSSSTTKRSISFSTPPPERVEMPSDRSPGGARRSVPDGIPVGSLAPSGPLRNCGSGSSIGGKSDGGFPASQAGLPRFSSKSSSSSRSADPGRLLDSRGSSSLMSAKSSKSNVMPAHGIGMPNIEGPLGPAGVHIEAAYDTASTGSTDKEEDEAPTRTT